MIFGSANLTPGAYALFAALRLSLLDELLTATLLGAASKAFFSFK